jgi:hypothetical protein
VFGKERDGRVAVQLVEASAEVRAMLGWGKGVERAIEVEHLQANCAEMLQRRCQNTAVQLPAPHFSSARLALERVPTVFPL